MNNSYLSAQYNPRNYEKRANHFAVPNDPLSSTPKIRVVVRKRPLTSKEETNNDKDVLDVKNDRQLVVKELK